MVKVARWVCCNIQEKNSNEVMSNIIPAPYRIILLWREKRCGFLIKNKSERVMKFMPRDEP